MTKKLRLAAAMAVLTIPALAAAQTVPEGAAIAREKAQVSTESAAQRDKRMKWWRDARFGMFIHWGVYSVPAGKWGDHTDNGEWIMNKEKIPVSQYRPLAEQFDPVKYDPGKWAQIAKDAGARYIVITAKHHDGFALWPSAVSKWNIAEATPYKKDVLGPLVTAAHQKGLKIGFYYSQAQDWINPGGAKLGYTEGSAWDDAQKGSFDDYLKNVAVPQTRELLTRYPIDILWWDTPTDMNPNRAIQLNAALALRPNIITNDRLGGGFAGDFRTPEQFIPIVMEPGDWETCMTLNGHWGYNAYDTNFKSSTDLIRKLAEVASKGGNFLLNVGPDSKGEIPQPNVERLQAIGAWLHVNGEAIYGTDAGPFDYTPYGAVTRKGKRLYVHVYDWPTNGKLRLPLQNATAHAMLLAKPGQALRVTRQGGQLVVAVPLKAPDAADSVVVVDLAERPRTLPLLTEGAIVKASSELDSESRAANVFDGQNSSVWRGAKADKEASLEIVLPAEHAVGGIGFGEPDNWPRLHQTYKVEAQVGGNWRTVTDGQTDGHGIRRGFSPVVASKFRITMNESAGSPGLSEVRLYRAR